MVSTMACVFLSWSLLGVMAAEPQCAVDANGKSSCQDTTAMLQSRTQVTKIDIDETEGNYGMTLASKDVANRTIKAMSSCSMPPHMQHLKAPSADWTVPGQCTAQCNERCCYNGDCNKCYEGPTPGCLAEATRCSLPPPMPHLMASSAVWTVRGQCTAQCNNRCCYDGDCNKCYEGPTAACVAQATTQPPTAPPATTQAPTTAPVTQPPTEADNPTVAPTTQAIYGQWIVQRTHESYGGEQFDIFCGKSTDTFGTACKPSAWCQDHQSFATGHSIVNGEGVEVVGAWYCCNQGNVIIKGAPTFHEDSSCIPQPTTQAPPATTPPPATTQPPAAACPQSCMDIIKAGGVEMHYNLCALNFDNCQGCSECGDGPGDDFGGGEFGPLS